LCAGQDPSGALDDGHIDHLPVDRGGRTVGPGQVENAARPVELGR